MQSLRFLTGSFCALTLISCSTPEVVFEHPPVPATSSAASTSSAEATEEPVVENPAVKPGSVLIKVPFASQAPLGNWDDPYQEACEEASLILVHHFLEDLAISPSQMDDAIIAITRWEGLEGYSQDVTVEELAEIAEKYYGYSSRVLTDVTEESIERELAAGNPVIVPLAGRDLGNPYYSGEGPWYHMLVIVGYDDSQFITQDVGTKRGENYAYDKGVILSAVHDWTGVKEEIRTGPKAALVVTK
ncbi:MAG: C39 family peptidase [Candidatus Peregrinibacteria bacterium]|nr:C39 family peptidase [Candidatus Peregrinibacteria bacterium]